MEALTRLVSESLARHGFNRPVDPRRLQWSRWFLCDSPHSLLVVPSKPGIFAIAEEICGAADTFARPANGQDKAQEAKAREAKDREGKNREGNDRETKAREGHDLSRATKGSDGYAALAAEVSSPKRMLAVLQFSEDDDMAFTLDRMFTKPNAMRDRLSSGRCFVRFVVIEDEDQRRTVCAALNQWLISSAEKATGIPAGFSSSLEMASIERTPSPATAINTKTSIKMNAPVQPAHLDSGFNQNHHCPPPFPSGF